MLGKLTERGLSECYERCTSSEAAGHLPEACTPFQSVDAYFTHGHSTAKDICTKPTHACRPQHRLKHPPHNPLHSPVQLPLLQILIKTHLIHPLSSPLNEHMPRQPSILHKPQLRIHARGRTRRRRPQREQRPSPLPPHPINLRHDFSRNTLTSVVWGNEELLDVGAEGTGFRGGLVQY